MDENVVPPKNCAQEASKKNTPWRKMLKELKNLNFSYVTPPVSVWFPHEITQIVSYLHHILIQDIMDREWLMPHCSVCYTIFTDFNSWEIDTLRFTKIPKLIEAEKEFIRNIASKSTI